MSLRAGLFGSSLTRHPCLPAAFCNFVVHIASLSDHFQRKNKHNDRQSKQNASGLFHTCRVRTVDILEFAPHTQLPQVQLPHGERLRPAPDIPAAAISDTNNAEIGHHTIHSNVKLIQKAHRMFHDLFHDGLAEVNGYFNFRFEP